MIDNSAAITAAVLPVPGTPVSYATTTSYDRLNRPVNVSFSPAPASAVPAAGSVTFAHAYNAANQRIRQTVTDNSWWFYPPASASTVGYTSNAANQYTAVGAVTPAYNANGNLTSDGTFSFGYDAENRLTSAIAAGNSNSYAHDAQGRRKTRTSTGTTTVTVTDADNRPVLEYSGSSGALLRWYAYGLGSNDVLSQITVGGSRATMVPDIQGSVLATLDSGTGAFARQNYLPYGKSFSNSIPGTFGYTGQRIDAESGPYDYRARMYHTGWGRFLQPDPIGLAGGKNLYAYVENDPLNNVDPSGLASDGSQQGFNLFGQAGGNGLGFSNDAQTAFQYFTPQPIPNAQSNQFDAPIVLAGGATTVRPWESGGGTGGPGGVSAGRGAYSLSPDFYVSPGGTAVQTPRGMPGDTYQISPSAGGGGFRFTNPNNPNDLIRTMPGNPNSPNPAQQQPYTIQQRNGQAYDINGNRVSPSDPAAHIQSNQFQYFPP
jgi:RHS repeat-associated protein